MFLHPFMLAGLAATAVPVVIHLLSRRRTVDIAWAAMRFLRAADDRNRRRLQLEDLLLLALRCAVLALLALAAAGPVLGRLGSVTRGSVTAVIVLDDSASMTGTDGVASRFDNAKASAARYINDLPAGSAVAVLMGSDTVATLIPTPTRDLSLARKLIAEAPVTDRGTNLLPAVRAAIELLRPIRGAKQLAIFTDGQRGSGRPDDLAAALRDAPEVSAHLVVVGPEVTANVGVADLRPAGDLTPAGRPLRFEATVTNYGSDVAQNLPVRLSIDGEPPTAEATVDRLLPGDSRVVPLYAKLPSPGPHAVTANLPPDRMPADDRRTVIVRGVDQVRVLIVDGNTTERSDRSAAAYLRAALMPVPADRRAEFFLQATTVPPSALAATQLSNYSAVFIAGVPPPDAAALLAGYVRNGGGLIVFPDAESRDHSFADLHLLPATIGAVHGDASHPMSLSAGPFDHPIASLWTDTANGSPASVHVFRAATLTPDAATTADAGPAKVVLRFADGSPFAMERPFGRGRCVLFSIGADTAASDLPDRGGLFVPLIYRSLASIITRGDEPLNITVGQPLQGSAPIADVGHAVALRTPAGPADTTVTLAGYGAAFRYDATDRAGPYTATVNGVTSLFAAQADPAESRLDTLTAADRAALSSVATVSDGITEAASVPTRGVGGGTSLSLLIAALTLALAEPFLANGFSRSR